MEKNLKKVRTIAILLIGVLISIIAFVGIYVKEYGIWKNVLPDFKLGMELEGVKELHYVLDDSEEEKEVYVDSEGNYSGEVLENDSSDTSVSLETENSETVEAQNENSKDIEGYTRETRTIKANEDDVINDVNFEIAKNILQERLETLDLYEYNIRQDTVTGEIIVEVPDDDKIEQEQSMISTVGNIDVIDYQTGLILIKDSNIKKATMIGNNTSEGYQAYLILDFDKQGTEKLKEISNKYQAVTDENGEETKNYISIQMDGQTLITTYFSEEIANGSLQLPMGQATQDYNEYVETAKTVSMIADIINQDTMPLAYTLSSDNHIGSVVTEDVIQKVTIVFIAIILLISLYLIVKYKFEGFKSAILCIGYIGLLSIIIRYTNVIITINSLIALVSVIVINYLFNIRFLNKSKSNNDRKSVFIQTMKELYLAIVPVCIISVIFTLMSSVVISSIGMVLFWGILIQAIYDCLLIL